MRTLTPIDPQTHGVNDPLACKQRSDRTERFQRYAANQQEEAARLALAQAVVSTRMVLAKL